MNVTPFETQPDRTFMSPESFEVVLQHWAKARIDTPLQLIGRFDDAAKQLIAIGGMLQGLLIAVFAFSSSAPRIPARGMLVIVGLLLTFMICAARVICTLSRNLEAMGAFELFKKIGTTGEANEQLEKEVRTWCAEMERLAKVKHHWLFAANILFLLSSAVTVSLVFWSMLPR